MKKDIYNIITKKLSGSQLNSGEQEYFNFWFESDDNKSTYENLNKVWDFSGSITYNMKVDVDAEWDKFKNFTHKKSKKSVRIIPIAIGSIAASIALAIGIFALVANRTITYQYSQLDSQVELPDGSQVWLNDNSEITIDKSFGKKDRNVQLSGEAFFEVEKSTIPFIIETPQNVYVKVLGTSFNLNSKAVNNNVELQVITGVVEFGNSIKNAVAVIEKGNEAVFISKKGQVISQESANYNKLAWRTGKCDFNNTPMKEVVLLLEKYLDITIRIPDSKIELNYSGHFIEPTAQQVAEIFAQAFSMTYTLNDKELIFLD